MRRTCAFWDAVEVGAQEVVIDLGGAARLDRDGQDAIEGLTCSAQELGRTLVSCVPMGRSAICSPRSRPPPDVELHKTLTAERW